MDPNAAIYTPSKAPSTRKSSNLGLKRGRSTTKVTLSSVKAEAAAASSSSTGTNKRPKRGQSQEAQDQGQSEEIDLLSQSTVAVPTGSRTQDTIDDTELDHLHPPPPRSSAVKSSDLFDDTLFDGDNVPTTSTTGTDTAPSTAHPSINRTLFPGNDTDMQAGAAALEGTGDGKSDEDDGDGDSKHELTDTDEEEEKEEEKEEVKILEEGPDLPCFIHLDSLNLHRTHNICIPLRKYVLFLTLLLFV